MARNYATEVFDLKRKNKSNKKNGGSTTYKTQSTRNYADEVFKSKRATQIGIDTLSSDLNSITKIIENARSGWQTKETMKNTLSSVQSMYDRLRKYQEYQKQYGGTDLSDVQKAIKGVIDGWDDLSEKYRGYNNKEAYNKAVKASADNQKKLESYDTKAGSKKISSLEKVLKTAKGYAGNISSLKGAQDNMSKRSYGMVKDSYSTKITSAEKELDKYLKSYGYSSIEELEKALGEEKLLKNNATRYQENLKLGSVGDVNSRYYDKDYEKYVAEGKKIPYTEVGTEDKKRVSYGKGRPVTKTTKSDTRMAAEALSNFLNGNTKRDEASAMNYYKDEEIFSLMTEKEFNDLAYYMAKDKEDGGDRTSKYVESIKDTLSYRRGKEISDSLEGKTFSQLAFGVDAGLDQFASGMKNLASDKDYMPTSHIQYASGEVREDLYHDDGRLARIGYDLINTTSNMLPSILTSSVVGVMNPVAGSVVGAGLLGASASGNAYQEMLNLGYDKGQAKTYAALVGISEAGLQYALGGIGKLGGVSGKIAKAVDAVDNALAKVAIRTGGSMLSEGFEEAVQEVLNPIFTIIAAGYDTGAEVDWGEVAYSGLLGALSGGLMEGPTVVANTYAEYSNNKQIGQNIRDNAKAQEVFDIASASPEASLAYEAYTRYANKGINAENVKDAQLGKLWQNARTDKENIAHDKNSTTSETLDAKFTYHELGDMAKVNPEARVTDAVNKGYNKMAEKAKKKETTDSLVEKGLSFEEGTEAYKLATEYKAKLDGGEKISKEEASKLTKVITEATKEATLQDVTERLTKLGEEGDVSKLAEAITKRTVGEDLTTEERHLIEDSEYGMSVFSESINGAIDYTNGMSEAESKLFLKNYDGKTDMDAYANAFNLMKEYANNPEGFTQEEVLAHKGVLSTEAATKIYNGLFHMADLEKAEANNKALQRLLKANKGQVGKVDDSIMNYGDKYVAGKVNWKGLSRKQQKAFVFAKGFFQALGSNVVFVGKEKDFNGAYEVKEDTIFIDVYAGVDLRTGRGDDIVINTISHEITHQMKVRTPDMHKTVANLVLDGLEKATGKTRNELISEEIEDLKSKGYSHTEDDAIDEIVARACEGMLSKSEAAREMFESLSPTEQNKLVAIIKDIIQKVTNWIDELLKSYGPHSKEAKDLLEDKERYEAISIMWDKMLREVQKQNKAMAENVEVSNDTISETESLNEMFADVSEAVGTDGKTLFQYRAMEEDEAIYRDMLNKHKDIIGITDNQIDDLFSTINKAIDIIKDNLEALDYAWDVDVDDRAFNPVKPNSDPLYRVSLDFSTLCRKRLLQQTIQQTLQNALNKNLSTEESIAIRDELLKIQEEGRKIEVACALCYVEAARMKSPKQINKFLNNREAVIKDFFSRRSGGSINEKVKNAELKARKELQKANPDGLVGKNGVVLDALTATKGSMLKADADYVREAGKKARESYKLTEHEQAELNAAKSMSIDNFTSAKGLENLAKNHPDIFDAYTSFVRNATRSKAIENDTWWRAGDSDSIGDNLIAQMNAENGLRSQSWSDFQVIHLLDYIAATIELSTKGAKRQSYTKVPDYVKLLGNTGDMINMSLIPERVFNGKLSYDGVEGMAYDIAKQLRDEYHGTVGTICIGINNEQIRMLLEDATIDMVIPYHHSSMSKAVRKLMHIPDWETYQNYQGEKNLSDAEAKAMAKEYGVKLKKDDKYQKALNFSEWFNLEEARQIAKLENENPSDMKAYKKYGKMYGGYMAMQNAANKYLKLCAERGLAPKFSNEKADFTKDANYWKLLIDRKMVDNVTGEIIEQKPIKPIFNEKSVLEILNDELARYPQVKADQEYATRKVIEKFLSGDMKMDKSTLDAIKKPVDNVTEVNVLESAKEDKMMLQGRDSEDNTSEVKKITLNMSEDERYEILKDKKITLPKVDTELYEKHLKEMPELLDKKLRKQDAKKLLKKISEDFGLFKEYDNEEFDIKFEFGSNNLRKSVNTQRGNYELFAQMLSCFSDVISNAVGIEVHNRNDIDYKVDETLEKMYVLFSAFENGTDVVPVKLSIKEFFDKGNRLYLAIALESIKIDRVVSMGVQDNLTHIRTSPVTLSIAELFKNVNVKDADFLKYLPNQFLDEMQIEAKNKALGVDKVKHMDREQITVYDLMGETERIVKENEKFKADIERLNERLKIERQVTHGNYFNENQLGAVAGHLRNIARSNMDKVELMKALKGVYSFIAQTENLTWEDVFERSYNLASEMLKESKPVTMVDDYAKQILREVKNTKISLNESQKAEAKNRFGSNWNRFFFGKVTITDNATPIESMWQQWANQYPGTFDTETNPMDMAEELYNILGSLKDSSEIIETYNTEETTRWLANEIYNQYWNVSPIRTTADKYDKQIKRLNYEHRQSMAEMREEYNSRLESQKLADTIHYKKQIAELNRKLRENRDRDVARAKELGQKRLDSFKENAERKTVIQSMTSTVMSLNKKLTTNSKDIHIPESLKPVVQNLLNAIDFSSKQLLGMKGSKKDARGLPTKADIDKEKALSKVHSMVSDEVNVFTLKNAINDALGLFENAEKVLNGTSDGNVDGSVVALDKDMIDGIKDIVKHLDILIERGEKTFVIQRMSTDHLKTLNGMVKSINHWATVADKALSNKHKKRISDLGMQTVEETNEFGIRQEYIKGIEDIKNFFNWSNLLPVNAFKRLGDAAMEFFDGLRDAQDKVTFNRNDVMDFMEKLKKDHKKANFKSWRTESKTFEVQLPGEEDTTKVTMPISYIMTLYCVAKQEDAQRHLYGVDALGNKLTYKDEKGNVHDGGGITIKGFKEGKFTLKVNKNLDNTVLNESIVKQITSVLTKEQIEVADALQEYMNTKGSEWGDAVSMALYGIKKFGVENYFPITVSPHTLNADKIRDEKASLFSILNYGFTKERNPNAKQSIEIGDIFDVFANHMNMVAIYNAYALPVFDIARWYNFKGKSENGKEIAVTTSIEKAFGKGALTYINNLIKDLNGQHESSRLGLISKIFKNTKVAMVGNSISVALLQPTAYLKAMVKIPPQYLLKSALYVKDFGAQKGVEKAKKYCGIALLKSQGYFETGVSANTTTKMMHDETLGEKVTEWSLKGAEIADERTWGLLWNACEFEVRAKRKDLKVGSQEFYNVVAEKLRDVIYETQVVDSPLTKSDLMRSGDTGAKMVTMFASEMSVAYNMVFEAAYQTHLDSKKMGKAKALKKNGKNLAITFMAYTLTSVATTALNALVSSFRYGNDDEEDENKFLKDFLADWLIIGKIPYFKEAISMAQGFESSRSDTLWLQSAFKAYEYWGKAQEGKEWAMEKSIDEALKSLSYVSGKAIYNQWRDLRALLRFIGVME